MKCGTDPLYFIFNYVKTIDDKGELRPFPEYAYLRELADQFHSNNKLILLKSRQMICSWLFVAYAVGLALFNRNYNILFFSQTQNDANDLIGRAYTIYENVPEYMQVPLRGARRSRMAIEWENGSRIRSFPSTAGAARGQTAQLVIFDEAAFHKDFRSLYQGVKPAVGKSGRIVIISTPNPDSRGKFYKELVKEHAKYGFTLSKVHYSQNPSKDDQWLAEEKANLSETQFKFEHGLSLDSRGAGKIFKGFDKNVHVIDAFDIPSHWRKFRSIDLGPNFACIWFAEDPTGVVYAYRERHIGGQPERVRAAIVLEDSEDERYDWTIADEADPQARRNLADAGLFNGPSGPKDILDSIYVIDQKFEQNRFVLMETVPRLVEQIADYVGDENGFPVKHQDDHGVDATRYFFAKYEKRQRSMGAEYVEQTSRAHIESDELYLGDQASVFDNMGTEGGYDLLESSY